MSTSRDFILFNYVSELPAEPPSSIDEYDFILVILPLRTVMNESQFLRLRYQDNDAFRSAFDGSVDHLEQLLSSALRYTKESNKLTFVANFVAPQTGYMGRLLPHADLRNPGYFCTQLNAELEKVVRSYPSAYVLDFDGIACSLGKRWLSDDVLVQSGHGAFMPDWDLWNDQNRLEKVTPLPGRLGYMTPSDVLAYLCREILASYRVAKQADSIKLVVTDLDDTLWRGVIMENDDPSTLDVEGWPLGYAEALQILRKRGVLLGIVSKNDHSYIERVWPKLFPHALALSDFAAVKINWSTKTENMEELLNEVSLLPRNVLYIDDNPVERAAMQEAFPQMRIIGSDPYEWRHLLIWSPETQVPFVTDESARRTEMVQAQVAREQSRKRMTREEFLASLDVRLTLKEFSSCDDAQFPRAFELLNKTNQFNTNGKRWTVEEIADAVAQGIRLFAFEVQDKFTSYGLVGVFIVRESTILQYVMSCRVLGLDVELAAVREVVLRLGGNASACIEETQSNIVSRDVWKKSGFVLASDGKWYVDRESVAAHPDHITLS
jgi:FkbH-like protein